MHSLDPRAKPAPLEWHQPLDAWAASLRAGGSSPNTIATRLDHLRRFARRQKIAPEAATEFDLIQWLGSTHWSAETRRSVRGSFRSFFQWANEHGLRPDNPAARLPRVRASAPHPHPAPEEAYEAAVAAASPRERLMLRLAGECGLRRAEIAQVHSNDIARDIVGYSLVVHGKGNKTRIVPLNDVAVRELLAWFDSNGPGYAFPGQIDGHLAPATVGTLISALLPPQYAAHSLRHRFATRVHSIDNDLLTTAALLGHSSVAVTQRYVAPDAAKGRHLVNAMNAPRTIDHGDNAQLGRASA